MKKYTTPCRRTRVEHGREASRRLVEEILTQRGRAIQAAVDFSLLRGAPPWVIELVMPDVRLLLGKPESTWRASDIRQLQESIDTLPLRILAAALTPAAEI